MPPRERVPTLSTQPATPDDTDLPDTLTEDDEVWDDDELTPEEEAELDAAYAENARRLAEVPPNPILDPHDDDAHTTACTRLQHATMTVLGQILDASNGVLLVRLDDALGTLHAVYKPTAGERPLWDFPAATLAQREVATYEISRQARLGVVPPTVLRTDAPLGPGSVQWWISADPAARADVDVLAPADVADDHLPVLHAETHDGEPLVVVHRDSTDLRAVALLDVVANNADRKGSALLTDTAGHTWGIDHGICLHAEPKLRTILWGWAGGPLTESETASLAALADLLDDESPLLDALHPLLVPDEVDALRARTAALLAGGQWPLPPVNRPAIPWPVL